MGWTEHVSVPEPEVPEAVDNVHYLPVAAVATAATRVDDGLLHPRAREEVFRGSPRGPVPPVADRIVPDRDDLIGLVGLQLLGAATYTLLSAWLAVQGLLHHGGWRVGLFLPMAVLLPLVVKAVLHTRARVGFWHHWCASRGFEPGSATEGGAMLPAGLDRSPLMGPSEERVVEFVGRRTLHDREAFVGSLLRLAPRSEGTDERAVPSGMWRASFVVMPLPEVVAARWPGASIRADHHANRPLPLRAMAGALVPNAAPEGRSHLAAAVEQDPHGLQRLVDPRLEQYLAERPMDIDIVGDLLVVVRDGAPGEDEAMDELCRDALVLHELLVAEHEVSQPVAAAPANAPRVALPPEQDDEPVIDLTREGWTQAEAA
ncbi:MAG: hypothetical protein JWM98_1985 [Thermoleophilia bacterium]|nr:hypothetical protein [Thermoleophilia bacterium]